MWSGGLLETECSILNAYCDLIRKAEHYIYIEVIMNKFFKINLRKEKTIKIKIII